MSFATTPNMDLELPAVLSEPGPVWANDLNTSLTTIDLHNHTTGKGVTVPLGGSSPGATVVGNVNFNSLYSPINQLSSNFVPTTVTTSLANDSVFVNNTTGRAELWYKDSAGAAFPLTNAGQVASAASSPLPGFNYVGTFPGYTFKDAAVTTNADLIGAGFWGVNSGSPIKVFAAATSVNTTTPIGGWSLGAITGNSFQLRFDTAGVGSYATVSHNVQPAGFNSQYYTGINQLGGGTPGATLDIYLEAISNVGVPLLQQRFNSTLSGAGAAPAGFGNQILFRAATTGSSSVNYVNTGALSSVWNNVSSEYGSITLQGAAGGSLTGTPGLTITNFGAGDCVGINGAAVVGQTLTLYGSTFPSASNTYSFGSGSLVWGNVYSRTLISDSTLALSAGGGGTVTVNAQLNPTTTGIALGNNNFPWANLFVDSAGTTNAAGGASGAFLASPQYSPANSLDLTNRHRANNIVAFCVVTVSGTTPTVQAGSWNVAGVTRSAQGVYIVTFSVSVSSNVVAVACYQNLVVNSTVGLISTTTNGTIVTVTMAAAGSGLDNSFQLIVTGPLASTP